jgi:hypothetical protein
MYGLHSRWFHVSVEQFDALHYVGMALYKLGILLLNLVPYIGSSAPIQSLRSQLSSCIH